MERTIKNEILPLILLCAGASTRMGFPKGLLSWKGNPLLVHQIEKFLSQEYGMENQIVLVLGHHHEHYRECLSQTLSRASLAKVQIAMNQEPERGQFSSLQEGVRAINQAKWAFLLPIDCPAPAPEVWSSLWQARDEHTSLVIPSSLKKAGHPLLLGKKILDFIRVSDSNTRLDEVIKTWPLAEKKYVEVTDASIHNNINTPAPH